MIGNICKISANIVKHCVHCESCHVKFFGALSILLSLIRVVKLPWPGARSNFFFRYTKHLVYNVSQWSQCRKTVVDACAQDSCLGLTVPGILSGGPPFCWRVFQCRVLARQGAATPVSSDTPPLSGKASDARPLFARRAFAAGGRLGECWQRLQFQVAPPATRPKSDLGHNVSQRQDNIVKHCETLCHNVEKNRRRCMCTGQLLGTDCPRNPQWVLHFAGGCFNVACLRDRGQRLPFLVTPPRAQARRVTRDPCSHAGRLQPAED